MSVGTLLSRATGVLRVAATLAALGVGVVSDAYNTANTTPNIVYELLLGGVLTSVFVPVFVGWAHDHGREDAWEVGGRFLTIVLVVLGAAALVGALAAPQIMRLYTIGVEDPARRSQQIALGSYFLRWFMPQIVFYGIGAVAGGILTANRRFAAPMFAPVLNNLAVIITMAVFIASRSHRDVAPVGLTTAQRTLLGAGTTLGVIAMTVALWPSLRAIGFRWRLRFDWRHGSVRRLVQLAKWVVVYVVANQLAYLVIIVFNGRIPIEGAYTAYSQAFVFFQLPHAIVAVSIVTALLPGMAERWAQRDAAGVRELSSRGLRDTEVLMLPAAAGYILLAGPIVALLAQHGAVDAADRALMARTVAAFAVGLPFFSAFQLLTRTFYATNDSRTPALVNVVAAGVNLVADVVFAFGFGWGVPGLALGHAASYVLGSAALFVLLRRRLGGADERRIATTLIRAAAAAFVTAAAAFVAAEAVAAVVDVERSPVRLLQVAAAIGVGVLVFIASALILRIEEVDELRSIIRSSLGRRKG
jgi:putative peptidoglycan lipid II flippase